MDKAGKKKLVKEILECTRIAFDIDSEDSDKDDIIVGL